MNVKQGQKLKDTCNICSASKIKCEKQRPSCSRCEKLGYRCVYSPARRKGRPHPSSNEGVQHDSAESVERPHEQQSNLPEPDHIYPGAGLQGVVEHTYNTESNSIQQRPQGRQHLQGSGHQDDHEDFIFDNQQSTSAFQDRSNNTFRCNLESSTSSTGTSSPSTLRSTIDTSTMDLDTSASNSLTTWSIKSDYSGHSGTECSDCALLAMKTLQHLTTSTSVQPFPRPTSPTSSCSFSSHDVIGPSFASQIHSASTAIKQLSAILICPCSSNPDVGLLNAALCAAILDTYWTILCSSIGSVSQQSTDMDTIMNGGIDSVVDQSNTTWSLINDLISDPDHVQSGAEPPGWRVNQQVIVRRVLEELPKAANVVMQFTRRYSDIGEETTITKKEGKEEVALLLPTLAIGQRSRLKDMVDKATSLLSSIH